MPFESFKPQQRQYRDEDMFLRANKTYLRLSAAVSTKLSRDILKVDLLVDKEKKELGLVQSRAGAVELVDLPNGQVVSCTSIIREFNLHKKKLPYLRTDEFSENYSGAKVYIFSLDV